RREVLFAILFGVDQNEIGLQGDDARQIGILGPPYPLDTADRRRRLGAVACRPDHRRAAGVNKVSVRLGTRLTIRRAGRGSVSLRPTSSALSITTFPCVRVV